MTRRDFVPVPTLPFWFWRNYWNFWEGLASLNLSPTYRQTPPICPFIGRNCSKPVFNDFTTNRANDNLSIYINFSLTLCVHCNIHRQEFIPKMWKDKKKPKHKLIEFYMIRTKYYNNGIRLRAVKWTIFAHTNYLYFFFFDVSDF